MDITLAKLKRSPLYSEQLGIDLTSDDEQGLFKWFLASLLFGGHISESIAGHTYQAFAAHGLLTPRKILGARWEYLVGGEFLFMRQWVSEKVDCGEISRNSC